MDGELTEMLKSARRHALRERQTRTVAEGRNTLAEIINSTYYGDGVTVITRRGKSAAAIVPMWALELLDQMLTVAQDTQAS
jgi:prevent-host-death family protein